MLNEGNTQDCEAKRESLNREIAALNETISSLKEHKAKLRSTEDDYRETALEIERKQKELQAAKNELKKLEFNCKDQPSQDNPDATIPDNESDSSNTRSPIEIDYPFSNRVRELQELRDPALRFRNVIAPAGYGKTKLIHKFAGEQKKDWITCWVSFDTNIEARESKTETLNELLRSLDSQQVSNRASEMPPDRVTNLKRGIDLFVEKIAKKTQNGAKVILFFDALERANKDVIVWLEDKLLVNLEQRKTVIKELRAIFTSRYEIERTNRPREIGANYHRLFLNPFRQSHILDVIKDRFDNPIITLRQETNLAWQIYELSLGHPKCLFSILDSIGTHPRLNEQGRLINPKELLEEIVIPVVNKEIIDEALTEAKIDFNTLSDIFVFRGISVPFLRILHRNGFINELDFSTPQSVDSFFDDQLLKTKLISNPRSDSFGYVVDPVVRHIISLQGIYSDKKRHKDLHECSLLIFEERLDNSSGMDQIKIIVEALYHFCNTLLLPKQNYSENFTAIIDRLQEWQQFFRCSEVRPKDYPNRLIDKILADLDLPLLLRMAIGNSKFEDLISSIKDSIRCE